MDKNEKQKLVTDAYEKLKAETDPKVFKAIGIDQIAIIIQDELPKKPLYCTGAIRKIISAKRN
jgi:hypothetical protein